MENPFILRGYAGEKYFCDRKHETKDLITDLRAGNNVTLIAPRRIGKTGLVQHVFAQPEINAHYNTFLIDIYATKSIEEMVQEMGRTILQALKPKGRKAWERFLDCLHSLRSSISFDMAGVPSWNVEMGDIQTPQTTLQEIFHYLGHAERPCIVAIDEFQTIRSYRDKNVEALLRTYVQHCPNATFVFSGSQRNMMSEMFLSHARPFYQSTAIKTLRPIERETYIDFAEALCGALPVTREMIGDVYDRFEGITWYVQRTMNKVFSMLSEGAPAADGIVGRAVEKILEESAFAYQALLFQLPSKQKELLTAIAKDGKAQGLLSTAFIRKHRLASSSSVQAALKGLLEKDFVTETEGTYEVYDRFFALWLRANG